MYFLLCVHQCVCVCVHLCIFVKGERCIQSEEEPEDLCAFVFPSLTLPWAPRPSFSAVRQGLSKSSGTAGLWPSLPGARTAGKSHRRAGAAFLQCGSKLWGQCWLILVACSPHCTLWDNFNEHYRVQSLASPKEQSQLTSLLRLSKGKADLLCNFAHHHLRSHTHTNL